MKVYRRLHHDWMATRAEVAFVAIVALAIGLLVVYSRPVGVIPATTTQNIVPATGEQGFNAEVFCKDPGTTVTKTINPDASGATYELKRVKDGVTETVTVVLAQTGDVLYAKHFWDSTTQQSEPAYVDEDVKSCIERKS